MMQNLVKSGVAKYKKKQIFNIQCFRCINSLHSVSCDILKWASGQVTAPHSSNFCVIHEVVQSLTRGQKIPSRREREIWNSFLQFREKKEKPEIPFTSFERKQRNLKEYSQLSRGEREMDFLFSSFKKRKRKWKQFLPFREEKEKF